MTAPQFITINEAWDLRDPDNASCVTYYEKADGTPTLLRVWRGRAPFFFMGEAPVFYHQAQKVPLNEAKAIFGADVS